MLLTLLNLAVLVAQKKPTGPSSSGDGAAGAVGALCYCVCWGVLIIPAIAGMWKAFDKAGQPGWASIIPIYNYVVLCQIAGKPVWWVLLLLIPFVNIVIAILLLIDFAAKFGKGAGFALGLVFLGFIFWPILGFGSAQYQGAGPGAGY